MSWKEARERALKVVELREKERAEYIEREARRQMDLMDKIQEIIEKGWTFSVHKKEEGMYTAVFYHQPTKKRVITWRCYLDEVMECVVEDWHQGKFIDADTTTNDTSKQDVSHQ